jgi:hypothetical protein
MVDVIIKYTPVKLRPHVYVPEEPGELQYMPTRLQNVFRREGTSQRSYKHNGPISGPKLINKVKNLEIQAVSFYVARTVCMFFFAESCGILYQAVC